MAETPIRRLRRMMPAAARQGARLRPGWSAPWRTGPPRARPGWLAQRRNRATRHRLPLKNRQTSCPAHRVVPPGGNRPRPPAFRRGLAGNSAVSVESRGLIHAQKALFQAFIQLIASAIDAHKSPAHWRPLCPRSRTTKMLAEAACAQTSGPFLRLFARRGRLGSPCTSPPGCTTAAR